MRYDETANKRRTAIWISTEIMEKLDDAYPKDNCKNRSEFMEKALEFYIGYLHSTIATEYLSKVLMQSLQATLIESERQHSGNLFRLAVEMNLMMNILANGLDISEETLKNMRSRCSREVKASRGRVRFEDALEYQNS